MGMERVLRHFVHQFRGTILLASAMNMRRMWDQQVVALVNGVSDQLSRTQGPG